MCRFARVTLDIVIGPRPPADQSHSLIVEPLVTTDIVIVTSKIIAGMPKHDQSVIFRTQTG